jgi:hypothetical protein
MCFLSAVAHAPRITRIDRVERLIGCSDLSYRQRQHRRIEPDRGPRTARTLAAGITISSSSCVSFRSGLQPAAARLSVFYAAQVALKSPRLAAARFRKSQRSQSIRLEGKSHQVFLLSILPSDMSDEFRGANCANRSRLLRQATRHFAGCTPPVTEKAAGRL